MDKGREFKNKPLTSSEHTELNPLTNLYTVETFMRVAKEFIKGIQPDTHYMVAIDLENFRLFNKFYGRDVGDRLLIYTSGCLKSLRNQYGGMAGHFGADNFCMIIPNRMELVEKLQDDILIGVNHWNDMSGFLPMFGVYQIDDTDVSPETMYDRATMVISQAAGNRSKRIHQYDPMVEKKLEEDWKLLTEIRNALVNDEFTFFAQPQCDIATGKIIGAESLVRWYHSTKGLIPPGVFVPILESSGFVPDLDRIVWKKVCEWLRSWLDRGYHPVPISINISRIDILSMDVPEYLLGLLRTYQLPPKYIKAEITESAYAEEDDKVSEAVKRLREEGFLVLMDDFGSGYSSLNMLKSIPVDVLKIDMRFLEMEADEEQKGISILESVVNMARLLGIPIIVEGVETKQHENILRNMGCRYTQGYYYYKPLPLDQFENLLADERKLDFGGLQCKQVESLHVREFLEGNLFTDTMLNNIIGPSAFYDVYENQIEILRVNEQYFQMSGISSQEDEDYGKKLWNHVRDDDRPLFFSLFERAYENYPGSAEGYIHYLRGDGQVLWVFLKIFFLHEKEGHKVFYSTLTDMTSIRQNNVQKHILTQPKVAEYGEEERNRLDDYYGNIPCGYGLSKIILDSDGNPADYEIIYANREMSQLCNGDVHRLRQLIFKIFGENESELLSKAYQAAFLGDTVNHYAYSSVSSHYLQLTLYQYEYGYVACLVRDITHMHIHEGALNSMVLAYREVYFLHLKDNYCRMIYPDENHLMERGNYESVVDRHFGTGKILKYNEKNVRHFLSLENLRTTLLTQNSVEYRYRRSAKDIEDEWCLTSISVSERENGIPKTAVITIRSIDNIIKEEEEKRQMRMAESLASMSDGFFIYRAIEDERILYANPAVMEIFGCVTMEEFMALVNNSFKGLVHPEDLERVEWEIENQIESSEENMDYVQYRIIRKDGQIRWVDDCGHLENSEWGEEHRLFYVFIKDITDSITSIQKEKMLKSNQFYQNE